VVSFQDVEQFALTLPETTSSPSYNHAPALRVNQKMLGRLRAEMADEYDELTGSPYGEVLMLKVADLGEKEALLASDPEVYFTVAHYDGYPAVLIRLSRISAEEVRELVTEAWMRIAPKRALKSYVSQGGVLPGEEG
jgi:hypothetical protein